MLSSGKDKNPSIMSPSSTKLRSLLPRSSESPDNITTPGDIKGLPPRRRVSRNKVITACRPCRIKKIKCDGGLPECGVCRHKMRSCDYPDEELLVGNLIKKQKALQDNVESFTSLFRYLQDRPASEANSLFERIRDGLSIDSALEFVTAEGGNSTLASRDLPNSRLKCTQQTKDFNVLFRDDTSSIEASDAIIQALRHGVECFFSYLGTMFPIYTRSEVDLIMTTFLASEPSSDDLVDRRIAYGELLAICALGLVYDKQTLPDGSADICTQFFEKAQLFVDYVLEKAPLRAMRICFCLGCYNVIAKSSLAITYTDRGILIGSSTGLNVGERPSYLPETEFKGYIRTLKALVTLRSWVTATLGHIPSPEISRCIHETREMMDDDKLDCTGEDVMIDMLQQKMAQITVLKANILRTAACFEVLSSAVLRQMQTDLELWRSSLPVYMRLEALVQSPTISPDQRRVTFYMHLFYMSALILKARALLATQGEIVSCSRDSEAASAILEGVHAARSSARLLGLILDEKAVVKNCWLTIYQCYITWLTLNYAAVKSFLVGGTSLFRQQDITLSDKCVEILKLCATRDRIAHAFHLRISEYQSLLKEHLPKTAAVDVDSGSFDDDSLDSSYLFAQSQGTTELDRRVHELWAMLCYPLNLLKGSKETNIHYPTIVEASVNADMNFAQHLVLSFGRAEDSGPIGLSPRSNSSTGSDGIEREVEGYVSGSVPYDWEVLPGIKCVGVEVESQCDVRG
ncbi:uncharacterized protein B0J16DRAFT_331339 [Fusarium flagelliforme]|uniref:uncharacterized protein n=1 Tax=Fusarium flagelliforme TaxID=2675880 RepID=UPI001E8D663C|nr:uncharacterized protein B0J16DRAFT_331339 [Fusarium flagelliforme]KAH7198911.1 hypothetical protein B0J16DRAFT_331339 [Fusarium flagelliforme]